jgi:hypothetical protein
MIEVSLWIAYTGYSMIPWTGEVLGGRRQVRVFKGMEDTTLETHRELPWLRVSSVYYDRIYSPQARDRFTQRARGKLPSIAHAAVAIDDRNLDIPLEAIVLQTVVAQYHVALGMCLQRGARCRDAILANPYRAYLTCSHQQGFVPYGLRGHAQLYLKRTD